MLTVLLLHNLGRYYKDRINGSRADNIGQAIGFLERALAATSRDEYPAAWATTAAQSATPTTSASAAITRRTFSAP